MEQLTVAQAKEQGYSKFIYDTGEYQHVHNLDEINDEDFKQGKILLCQKEPFSPTCMSEKDIIETLAEQISCQHSDDTGDDTDDVFDKIKTVEESTLTPFVDAVNEKLKSMKFWHSAEIELIP